MIRILLESAACIEYFGIELEYVCRYFILSHKIFPFPLYLTLHCPRMKVKKFERSSVVFICLHMMVVFGNHFIIILAFVSFHNHSVECVKPMLHYRQDVYRKIHQLRINNKIKSEAVECPYKCICYHSQIRCMFLRLRRLPKFYPNATRRL